MGSVNGTTCARRVSVEKEGGGGGGGVAYPSTLRCIIHGVVIDARGG